MDNENLGYVHVAYANNNQESWEWDETNIYYHPGKRRWFYDVQGGCSCNMYEFEEDGLTEFPISDLNKVIRESVSFAQYRDSVRREVKAYIKEHKL